MSLLWQVDRGGYHIERPEAGRKSAAGKRPAAAKTIASEGRTRGSGARIAPNHGPLAFVDVLKMDGLYRCLADCPPTAEGALSFVSRYGFLRSHAGEHLGDICHEIRVIRSLLKAKEARNWESLHLWLVDNAKAIRLKPDLLPGDPPKLFFQPVTLRDAIYLQFLEDLTTGANLRKCKRPGCGEWFKYGPGTEHRSTAQYCTPKCQNADKYMKRKECAA